MTTLFSPITLGSLTVRNRIWLAPMCQYSCHNQDGVPGQWHMAHLGSRATGGFGMIVTEAAAVAPEGRISPHDVGIWNDEQAQAWKPIVDFVHSQGAKIAPQLAHAGRKASTYRPFPGEPKGSVPLGQGGWETVGASALAFPGLATPRELTAAQIAQIPTQFARSARLAKDVGFDAVEIHAAHGYLLHSFLSPLSNKRPDEYGADLPGRARLLYQTVAAIQAEVGVDFPIFVRISASEWTPGGFDIDEATTVASQLQQRGVVLVDVSSGGNVVADIPVGPAYQAPLAAQVKAAGVTTSAVGLITEATQAESLLATGVADVVSIARAALRDPYWPLRAAAQLGVDWKDAPYQPQLVRGRF